MPSARKCNSESGIMQHTITEQDVADIRTGTPSDCATNESNVSVFLVGTLPSSATVRTFENNCETPDPKLQTVVGNDDQMRKEHSFDSMSDRNSNRRLSFQTNAEKGRNNYRKRPTEGEHLSNIHSQNELLNLHPQKGYYGCDLRTNANINSSHYKGKAPGCTAEASENSRSNHLRTEFGNANSVLLPCQVRVNVNQDNIIKSDGNKSFPGFHHFKGMSKKQMKNVKISEKENQYPKRVNKIMLPRVNVTKQKSEARQVPRIFINCNIKGSSSRNFGCRKIPFKKGVENTPRLMTEDSQKTYSGCMPVIRPICHRLLPAACKTFGNPVLLPRPRFQVNSASRRMMGTASRDVNPKVDSVRLLFPVPFQTQCNRTGNMENRTCVPRNPFVVARAADTGTRSKRNSPRPLEASESASVFLNNRRRESVNACKNNRKLRVFCNQESAVGSRINIHENRNEISKNVNSVKQPLDHDGKMRAANRHNVVGQGNNSKEESGGKDKIQTTTMMLDELSALLNNINEDLSGGFECPGLEMSVPIWKAELEKCISSVEKIKGAISVKFERNSKC